MNAIINNMRTDGLISEYDLGVVREAIQKGSDIMQSLLMIDGLTESKLLKYLADRFQCPFIEDISRYNTSKELMASFDVRILIERQIAPVRLEDSNVYAVISNPFDLTGIDELSFLSGQEIEFALAPKSDISRYIKSYLGLGADTIQSMMDEAQSNGLQFLTRIEDQELDLEDAAEGASIIRFVNQILTEAIEMRATDVHIEPFEDELRVRYRIDGVLQSASIPATVKQFQPAIVSRIKILSQLDIAEKRVPQDGRIQVVLAGKQVDIRVSIIPMLHGEAVVLRLLDCSSVLLGLDKIGMGKRDLNLFSEIIKRPHGIILVTGPTGSGKTTTLYAALSQINDIERKIVTIEDPIEYQLHGVNQIQVSNKRGLSFAKGLRSILRHDPDVILVGEIRDIETAEIAVQASLTGHLVFSTLHTNDASGALTRLVDMGVEPYLVASSLEGVLAQRLIRIICEKCKQQLPEEDVEQLKERYGDLVPDKLYKGTGCKACMGTGYHGRQGIFEQMVVSEDIRALLLKNESSGEIRVQAIKEGMCDLRQDAGRYLLQGKTTIDEVLRVTKDATVSYSG